MTVETRAPDRQVPFDESAEQQVLGSLLIDRDAIFKVADLLRVDDFYIARHQRIYDAAQALLERRERIDPLTIQMELSRREELDRAGGQAYLRALADGVPTAAEIDRYGHIVRDRAILRRLLGAATSIAADAYDEPTDIALALDRAEQRLFALRDESANAQLRHITASLQSNYEHLTDRMERPFEVSGIPSGFREVDYYTEGFTVGDLIVLAARPSVGKTSLALGMSFNVARRGHPVLLFSLEMDAKQIVSRYLALNSRMDLLALRTGNIIDTDAAAALHGLPVFIDDTPGISIMELRTKARRASTHEKIEVIIVDYLQLVRGGGDEENRVQEIATITRNLKSLARELGVVIIGLSQLSRAAGDSGGEPKLSTLRECVTGDTIVCLADGRRVPISELVGTCPEVLSVENDRIVTARTEKIWAVGRRPVFRVRLTSGRSIRATADHRLRAFAGWRHVRDLTTGDRLAIARRLPEPKSITEWPSERVGLLGQLIGDGSYIKGAPMRYTTSTEENSRFVAAAAINEFGAKVTRYLEVGNWHQLLISGNGNRWHPAGVNAWLRDLGIFGQRSYQKRVPCDAFRLANKQLAILLRHLWATDGSISVHKGGGGHSVYYATNSIGLAADVAALLLRFDIVTRTVRVEEAGYLPGYQVHVSGTEAQRRFIELIGTFGPRVEPAAAVMAATAGIVPNTNVDTIPREVFALVRGRMRDREITTREMARLRGTSHSGNGHFTFSPSRPHLATYAVLLEDSALMGLATNDLFWDEVIDVVADGEQLVYDLTVPDTSCWLADGIVSHNSGALEQDADIVIMLWRDREETPAGAPRLINGSVAKNRNGPTGGFQLLFESEQAKFFSKASDEGGPPA
ncbi:MAG: replicative DNA helicase [Chloroflexi bacterium]|nr:MAG: replicative DNA helicase [Chloroflexota bacterium]